MMSSFPRVLSGGSSHFRRYVPFETCFLRHRKCSLFQGDRIEGVDRAGWLAVAQEKSAYREQALPSKGARNQGKAHKGEND